MESSKKKKIIGCAEINSLPIDDVISNYNFKPLRRTRYYCVYRSPFREDKNPSFITYRNTNRYKDLATEESGSVIDFIVAIENCSVKEAIKIVKSKGFRIPVKKSFTKPTKMEKKSIITSINKVVKYSLLDYSRSRGISDDVTKRVFKEVNYQVNGRNYFSLGLENVVKGFELRNKYFKSCIYGKSFSFFHGKNKRVWICEGMFDYASILELSCQLKVNDSDSFIILNSITNYIKAKRIINSFEEIHLVLDRDKSGIELTKQIFETYNNRVIDHSNVYKNFNDLNEFLVNKNNENH